MKIILGLYMVFTGLTYYSMISYKPDFMGNLAGLLFSLCAGITLLIAWIIDLKKNKGVTKRNRYFFRLFTLNFVAMIIAIIISLVSKTGGNFVYSIDNLWGEGMGLVLLSPICAYVIGLIGDGITKMSKS